MSILSRIREFLWPSPPKGDFISKSLSKDIQEIMPGEVMTIVLHGRKFAIVEQEEFDMVLTRAGMERKQGVRS